MKFEGGRTLVNRPVGWPGLRPKTRQSLLYPLYNISNYIWPVSVPMILIEDPYRVVRFRHNSGKLGTVCLFKLARFYTPLRFLAINVISTLC